MTIDDRRQHGRSDAEKCFNDIVRKTQNHKWRMEICSGDYENVVGKRRWVGAPVFIYCFSASTFSE